ncbi:hypothetical protein AcW1_009881 [Taiwanofungus camphoratus]|nr:hypothetical protein AcV7_005234 [Antrodia cinnamomea]KAI0946411.1 hypothetical protein AcW1_009881 [Antrodia cinnamomea]
MVAYETVTAESDTHILHDGKILKKGSLLVAMINAAEFNKVMKAPEPVADRQGQLHKITEDLADFVGAIDGSGLFEYFEAEYVPLLRRPCSIVDSRRLREWFGNQNYGRAMIAAYWCKLHPGAITPGVRTNIARLLRDGGEPFQKEFYSIYPEAEQFA